MRPNHALAIAALTTVLAGGTAHAYPLNFGSAYVQPPGHGVIVAEPYMTTNASASGTWNYLSLGIVDGLAWGPVKRLGLSLDTLYVSVPGFKSDFGNSQATLHVGMGSLIPEAPVAVTLSPIVGIKTGEFGRSFIGLRGFVDWQILKQLTFVAAPGYYVRNDGLADPHRLKFDASLDYRLLDWLGLNLEFLSGGPHWDYGPDTRMGVVPGVTAYIGPATVFTFVRIPVLKAESAATLEPPSVVLGGSYAW